MRKDRGIIGWVLRIWQWSAPYPSVRVAAAGLLLLAPTGTTFGLMQAYDLTKIMLFAGAAVTIALPAAYMFLIAVPVLIIAIPLGAWDIYRHWKRGQAGSNVSKGS